MICFILRSIFRTYHYLFIKMILTNTCFEQNKKNIIGLSFLLQIVIIVVYCTGVLTSFVRPAHYPYFVMRVTCPKREHGVCKE